MSNGEKFRTGVKERDYNYFLKVQEIEETGKDEYKKKMENV